ncbi:MAG: NADH-quinone oxidoreductase subunit NuoN, partial [Pseudomonadota bacterium]
MTLLEQLSHLRGEMILAIGAMALLVYGVYVGDRAMRLISRLSSILLVVAGAFAYSGWSEPNPVLLFGGGLAADKFSVFARTFIYLAAAVSIALAEDYLTREKLARFEFPILVLLAALGMGIMVSANDLIALYLGVELQSLAFYVLAAFNRDSRRSTEAGLKYFVLGALSSGLLLYGASLIYGFVGATTFEAIGAQLAGETSVGLVVGLVFLIAGLAFKVSAAPFHMWTPDVYEGAATPVTALFAAAPKLAGMALFARVLVDPFEAAVEDWRMVIALIAAASMAIGAFSALVQTNIKRLMAYSSIGHMGYAAVGLAAGGPEGASAVLLYLTVYVIMTLGTFALILSMRRREGLAERIEDLAGLSQTRPWMAMAMTILMFSLAGVPPTAGFWGKWWVFKA